MPPYLPVKVYAHRKIVLSRVINYLDMGCYRLEHCHIYGVSDFLLAHSTEFNTLKGKLWNIKINYLRNKSL